MKTNETKTDAIAMATSWRLLIKMKMLSDTKMDDKERHQVKSDNSNSSILQIATQRTAAHTGQSHTFQGKKLVAVIYIYSNLRRWGRHERRTLISSTAERRIEIIHCNQIEWLLKWIKYLTISSTSNHHSRCNLGFVYKYMMEVSFIGKMSERRNLHSLRLSGKNWS